MPSGPAPCQAVGILWLTGSYQRPTSGWQKPPTSCPIAVHRHPCRWFPTPKPALGCRCFWNLGNRKPGISVPSRESPCGSGPHPSIGCSVGIPQRLPHTSLGNAIMPSTLLSPPDLSSVEWSRRRQSLKILSAVACHLPSFWDQRAQASGLQSANHTLINSYRRWKRSLCL